ncbi:MAG: hypothetical protein ACYC6J_08590 [Coriobacteriia bacterium]
MLDRIDPGPGWRLLKVREIRARGDEFFCNGWKPTVMAGEPLPKNGFLTRRRTAPRATKAIATRATVICGTPDGARTMNAISRESGLTEYDCERIRKAWENMQVSTAKYIMLEIQREGEP